MEFFGDYWSKKGNEENVENVEKVEDSRDEVVPICGNVCKNRHFDRYTHGELDDNIRIH